jgi:flavin-binding protein dodecin
MSAVTEVTEDQQYRLFSDPSMRITVPMVLWRPMLRLAGGAGKVTDAAASCVVGGNTTRWAVVWITDSSIVYGSASKELIGVWSAHSDDQACEDAVTWARSISEVQWVEAVEPEVRDLTGAKSWIWTERYRVHFQDGTTLELPLFPNLSGGAAAAEPALEVLDAVIARLPGDSS